MNKKDMIIVSLYAGIIIFYFIAMSLILSSCSTTKPPVVEASRPARANYIYKVQTVSKDNDTTFQKIIR